MRENETIACALTNCCVGTIVKVKKSKRRSQLIQKTNNNWINH